MKKEAMKFLGAIVCVVLIGALTGCSVKFYRGHPEDLREIGSLKNRLEELEDTKRLLEERLRNEIRDKQVQLDITKRGLVITFMAEVLFDSGKTVLKKGAFPVLDKMISVLKEKVSDKNIGIEGHTDNQPIKHSKWKSNWELSTARATTVLHYLEDAGINPGKLQATGYGEYRPVAPNDTKKNKQRNRRVEVIVLPEEDINIISYDEEEK